MNVCEKTQGKTCGKSQVRTMSAKQELIKEVRSRIESRGYDVVDIVRDLLSTRSGAMSRVDG